MAEDGGKKEEEKLEFTPEGEALGYISLDQARVLAMRTAKESPGAYGRRFRNFPMAFEVVKDDETEDHYAVTLSFRPQGRFAGIPGQEQFFIEKEGGVAHRQVLSLPVAEGGRHLPVVPIAIGLVAVATAAALGVVLVGGGGSGEGDGNEAPVPTVAAAPTSTQVRPSPTVVPLAVILTPVSAPELTTEAALVPEPTRTPTPTLAPTPLPTSTSTPVPTPKPIPTLTPTKVRTPTVVAGSLSSSQSGSTPAYQLSNFHVFHTDLRSMEFKVDYIYSGEPGKMAFSVRVYREDEELPICLGESELSSENGAGTATMTASICPRVQLTDIISTNWVRVDMFSGSAHVLSEIFRSGRLWLPSLAAPAVLTPTRLPAATLAPTLTPTPVPTATAIPTPTPAVSSTLIQLTYFTFDSHKDDVLRIQGMPTEVKRYDVLGYYYWDYGRSRVTFDVASDRVTEWDNSGGNLKLQ